MANRRHSARRIKRLRTYNVREAAKATGATPETVRRWHKNGLEAVAGVYPSSSAASTSSRFWTAATKRKGSPAAPAACFAFAVRHQKRPAFGEVEFWADGPKLGTLRGLCPDCSAIMNRRTSFAKLKAAAGGLTVSMRPADPHLSGTPEPNSYPHFERA